MLPQELHLGKFANIDIEIDDECPTKQYPATPQWIDIFSIFKRPHMLGKNGLYKA